jgi:hypothetical protein
MREKVFDLVGTEIDRHEKDMAVVSSSSLTLSGLSNNTELNVVIQGNQNHQELTTPRYALRATRDERAAVSRDTIYEMGSKQSLPE